MEGGCIVPKELLTDDNIAIGIFLKDKGFPTPHDYKTICAALGGACEYYGLPLFEKNHIGYPNTAKAKKVC